MTDVGLKRGHKAGLVSLLYGRRNIRAVIGGFTPGSPFAFCGQFLPENPPEPGFPRHLANGQAKFGFEFWSQPHGFSPAPGAERIGCQWVT